MTFSTHSKWRGLESWLVALFVAALLAFWFHANLSFSRPPLPKPEPFGSAKIPYSDALSPWLSGSLNYYVHGVPQTNLYRPTVGLFFSAILTVFQSVEAIPVFFIGIFMATLAYLFTCGTNRLRLIATGTLVALVLTYDDGFALLNPECVTVDMWTMTCSVVGLCLIGLSVGSGRSRWLAATTGFMLLGLAAAVRGPQLLGGGFVLLFCLVSWLRQRDWRAIGCSILAFLLPTVVDLSIQSKYDVTNNGAVNLYCVYTDPERGWTPRSDERYHRENPTNREVAIGYFKFLRTPEGEGFIRWTLGFAPSHNATQLVKPSFLLLLLLCAAGGLWESQKFPAPQSDPEAANPGLHQRWLRWVFRICWVGFVIVAGQIARAAPSGLFHPVLWLAALLAVAGIAASRPLSVCFALCYIGSVFLHAAFGVSGAFRASMTYEIYLLFSIISFLVERRSSCPSSRLGLRGLAPVCAAGLLLLTAGYFGNLIGRTGQKSVLRTELAKANRVMKVSADSVFDRSLYIDGRSTLFYTSYDPLPFGSLRTYKSIATPGGFFHGSLFKPCVVTWESK